MHKIVAIGELLWDVLPAGPRLGGAIANFAVFSARLGNTAALLTSVGQDPFGDEALTLLGDQNLNPNLDLSAVQRTPSHPTGTVEVTFSAANQPAYTISPNVAWDFIEFPPSAAALAQSAAAICFGTLAQRQPASRSAIHSFVTATRPECLRVCDVNLRMPHCTAETLRWSMAHATLIKISDEELPTVAGLLGVFPPSILPLEAAYALLNLFPACNLVAFTLGAKGSLLVTREDHVLHPGFPITVVDTVGAGDAFIAGVVYAYLRRASLAAMAEIGNLCGSFTASQPAATPTLPSELLHRIESTLSRENSGSKVR
jgi:fructokinase